MKLENKVNFRINEIRVVCGTVKAMCVKSNAHGKHVFELYHKQTEKGYLQRTLKI